VSFKCYQCLVIQMVVLRASLSATICYDSESTDLKSVLGTLAHFLARPTGETLEAISQDFKANLAAARLARR
jgi:hypothetical protein